MEGDRLRSGHPGLDAVELAVVLVSNEVPAFPVHPRRVRAQEARLADRLGRLASALGATSIRLGGAPLLPLPVRSPRVVAREVGARPEPT